MPTRNLRLAWPVSYELKGPDTPNQLAILLHGYQQKGELIMAMLGDCFADDTLVIAPDGPFPTVAQTGAGRRFLGFTWYFFDSEANRYLTPMDQSLDILTELILSLDLGHLPTRVVGFSQGGYLAPFLAQRLPAATQVVGLNCRFRDEVLRGPLPFRLDALHGARDILVDPNRARDCHRAILADGGEGQFRELPQSGHRIDADLRLALKDMLRF